MAVNHVISFIIPAHNEERLLGPTLDAITAAASRLDQPSEIIVVNDASTDGTRDIAARPGVRVIDVNLRQISAVRNAGAHAAAGDVLIFVDADTLVTPDVVAAAVAAMQSGAVGGGARLIWDGEMPWWAHVLARLTLWVMLIGGMAAGCFVFCTRKAFEAVGGFNEGVYATEELWLSRALQREGRFVILDETVTTSARKLRTYSGVEILRMMIPLLTRGPYVFRDRRALGLWYGERRNDGN